jgi:hypothetical protein
MKIVYLDTIGVRGSCAVDIWSKLDYETRVIVLSRMVHRVRLIYNIGCQLADTVSNHDI